MKILKKRKQKTFLQSITLLTIAFGVALIVVLIGIGIEKTINFINNPLGDVLHFSEISITKQAKAEKNNTLDVLIGTEMENAIPFIKKASVYYELPEEIYLGIAFAESSFNRFKCFNPWGIDTGKGNDPRCYQSWEHSVNGFSQLIKYYYLNEGKLTAEQLQMKYVGWNNPDWIVNVKQYYNPQIKVEL